MKRPSINLIFSKFIAIVKPFLYQSQIAVAYLRPCQTSMQEYYDITFLRN